MPAEVAGAAILGFPRSGTTLLRRLLDAHPELAAPPETGLLSASVRFLETETIVGGVPVDVVSGLGMAGFAPESVIDGVRDASRRFLDAYARDRDARMWVEKNPYDVFRARAIADLWPDLKLVCLVRHGLDVVASTLELVSTTDRWFAPLHAYLRRNPRPSLAVAEAWRDTTLELIALAEEQPDRVLLVTYEQLVEDTSATLERIGALLGVAFDPGLLDGALEAQGDQGFGDWKTYTRKQVHTDSVARHRQLSRTHLYELVEIVGPTLDALGYPRPRTRKPPAGQDAARRHQLGLIVQAMRAED